MKTMPEVSLMSYIRISLNSGNWFLATNYKTLKINSEQPKKLFFFPQPKNGIISHNQARNAGLFLGGVFVNTAYFK